eukprot:31506-Pelagococcus_subviridis.AAC.9
MWRDAIGRLEESIRSIAHEADIRSSSTYDASTSAVISLLFERGEDGSLLRRARDGAAGRQHRRRGRGGGADLLVVVLEIVRERGVVQTEAGRRRPAPAGVPPVAVAASVEELG